MRGSRRNDVNRKLDQGLSMRISSAFSAFVACLALSGSALAADWQAVATAGGERVEIDKTRIMRIAPGRTVAWTRLVLGRELKDSGGSYTAVQAMNRYECKAGKFSTLRRVYMKGSVAVREERVRSPKEVSVSEDSLDGKLLVEACKLRTVGEAHAIAAAAANAAVAAKEAQQDKPGVMYADVRAAGEEPRSQAVTVAENAAPDPAAEQRPKSAAETKIEIRPPGERPRFFGLPVPDRPQPSASKEAAPDEVKAAVAKPAESKPVAKPAPAPAPVPVANITLHEREIQFATSGPRRTPVRRSKPAPKPTRKPVPEAVVQHPAVHWSYEGEGSPANWGKLKPEYKLCATGQRQSPIDIRDGIGVDLEPIQFNYLPTHFNIVDNGHSVQVNVGKGSTMTIMGRTYEFVQFHFHRPSEVRVNGKSFDMVMHLVHRDSEGNLAVIAVLLEQGQENPLIQTLWNHLPLEENLYVTPSVAIDLNALLPENRQYYTYMGSLTTPPCTEDVLWMVFKQPLKISPEQIAIFARLYPYNARPVQPTNGRLIKQNR
jgi:carbonic anhydrase